MSKQDVLNRVTVKSVKEDAKPVAKVIAIDPKSPATPRLTYALYNANRAASKIDGCKVFNDWHKQGLTHGECLELIAAYNKVTGYVYAPKKEVKAGSTKPAVNAKKGTGKAGRKAAVTPEQSSLPNRPINQELVKGQIQALKEMKAEGLLSVAELAEALRLLQV